MTTPNLEVTHSEKLIKQQILRKVFLFLLGAISLGYLLLEDNLFEFAGKYRNVNPGQQQFQMDFYQQRAIDDSKKWLLSREEFLKEFMSAPKGIEHKTIVNKIAMVHDSYITYLTSLGQQAQMLVDMAHDFSMLENDANFKPAYVKLSSTYSQIRSNTNAIAGCVKRFQDKYNDITNHDSSDNGVARSIMAIGSSMSGLFTDSDKDYLTCSKSVSEFNQAIADVVKIYPDVLRRMNEKAEEEEHLKKVFHIIFAILLAFLPGIATLKEIGEATRNQPFLMVGDGYFFALIKIFGQPDN